MGISADRLRRAQLAVLLNRRGAQTGWCPTITLISTASALAWIVGSKAVCRAGAADHGCGPSKRIWTPCALRLFVVIKFLGSITPW